jgi:oxaloacetate decarboxylase gamma subunit
MITHLKREAVMDITGSLIEAAHLMLIGMSVVFVFLGMLVWLTKLLARVAGEENEVSEVASAAIVPQAVSAVPAQTVAAITTAVHQYRQTKLKSKITTGV